MLPRFQGLDPFQPHLTMDENREKRAIKIGQGLYRIIKRIVAPEANRFLVGKGLLPLLPLLPAPNPLLETYAIHGKMNHDESPIADQFNGHRQRIRG
jgi:hypothetical protein